VSKFQNRRDNILSAQERVESARKCIQLLNNDKVKSGMQRRELLFLEDQLRFSNHIGFTISELQLQWLRDLVSKYVA
jgi:hypothetical protein